jgi:hypothetical protein
MDVAAERMGYHPESLRQRVRQLRQQGKVTDIGRPPAEYPVGDDALPGQVVVMWPNPQVALIRSDVPPDLLIPKRGRRAKSGSAGISNAK